MKNLTGTRVWHRYDNGLPESDLEEYVIYGYNPDYGGHYIRRGSFARGRYRGFNTIFPMGNPKL